MHIIVSCEEEEHQIPLTGQEIIRDKRQLLEVLLGGLVGYNRPPPLYYGKIWFILLDLQGLNIFSNV